MQGLCINAPDKSNLVVGETYFLYPHGPAYHASRFSRPGSHFGTYQKKYFEIVAGVAVEAVEEWPPEPVQPAEPPRLDKGKIYEAELIWRRNSYGAQLGNYFITAINNCYSCKSDCYFYAAAALQQPQGRYPLHWFINIREYGIDVAVELPQDQWQQLKYI
ncbi:hypothetical protein ACIQZG_20740 [Lysinibacillus sp. NPDC096418]|uniref:hypothetical protein n=1 Tax=Lysinibacillus sp. NPDC096418 TaxID=3364138 RepID=UPI003826ECBD